MIITPLFHSRLLAKLIPAHPAEGAATLGFQEIDQNPPAPGFLATARLSIPRSGSVEFDFRKFSLSGQPPRSDAEGRPVDLNGIIALGVLSNVPLNVAPGTLPWENSPLPASIRCLSYTGCLYIYADSRSIVFTNPSADTVAELTIVAIGENTEPYALAHNGIPFHIGGIPLTHTPS